MRAAKLSVNTPATALASAIVDDDGSAEALDVEASSVRFEVGRGRGARADCSPVELPPDLTVIENAEHLKPASESYSVTTSATCAKGPLGPADVQGAVASSNTTALVPAEAPDVGVLMSQLPSNAPSALYAMLETQVRCPYLYQRASSKRQRNISTPQPLCAGRVEHGPSPLLLVRCC